jgi:zinc/manganese transport system substrate-binding protein
MKPRYAANVFRLLAALLSILAAISPCRAADPIPVVASFSILGDLTQAVGAERIRVHMLVGADQDAHVYQPTPADAKLIARARLVVTNGLGFEGWIARLVQAAGYKGEVVVATRGIKPLATGGHSHGHDHGNADPHAWHDIANTKRYVANIEAALTRIDPAGTTLFRANAQAYTAQLDKLDAEIRASIAKLPRDRRSVVTSHDAFGYFARAYGLRFVAPVGVSTEAQASAADVANLIRQIKRDRIPAVFMENVSDPRLLERIRVESGAKTGGVLYSDALSAHGGPAATYLDLMRHNLRTLVSALVP